MFWPHLLTSFRCASVFPPSAPSSKFCPQSRPPCWVAPTSARRSQSRWVFITALWSISWNGSFQPPSSPHLSHTTGYRDVGPQCSEPDAVCKGDGQGGGGSFHQDPNRRRLHPPLGQKDPLVPVRHWTIREDIEWTDTYFIRAMTSVRPIPAWAEFLYSSHVLSVTVAVLVEFKQWDGECKLWVRF